MNIDPTYKLYKEFTDGLLQGVVIKYLLLNAFLDVREHPEASREELEELAEHIAIGLINN